MARLPLISNACRWAAAGVRRWAAEGRPPTIQLQGQFQAVLSSIEKVMGGRRPLEVCTGPYWWAATGMPGVRWAAEGRLLAMQLQVAIGRVYSARL